MRQNGAGLEVPLGGPARAAKAPGAVGSPPLEPGPGDLDHFGGGIEPGPGARQRPRHAGGDGVRAATGQVVADVAKRVRQQRDAVRAQLEALESQRPRLVEHDLADPLEPIEEIAAAHEEARPAQARLHDLIGQRQRDPDRAWTGHDQQRDGDVERASGAARPPEEKSRASDGQDRDDPAARQPVPEAQVARCPGSRRGLPQERDQRGVGEGLQRDHRERGVAGVEAAGRQQRARGHVPGRRLAGDPVGGEPGARVHQPGVHGDQLARRDQQSVVLSDRGSRHDVQPVVALEAADVDAVGPVVGQQHLSVAVDDPLLQEPSQQHQRDEDVQGVEVRHLAAAPAGELGDRGGVDQRDAQRDRQVQVQDPAAQRGRRRLEEGPAADGDDAGRQDQRQPGEEAVGLPVGAREPKVEADREEHHVHRQRRRDAEPPDGARRFAGGRLPAGPELVPEPLDGGDPARHVEEAPAPGQPNLAERRVDDHVDAARAAAEGLVHQPDAGRAVDPLYVQIAGLRIGVVAIRQDWLQPGVPARDRRRADGRDRPAGQIVVAAEVLGPQQRGDALTSRATIKRGRRPVGDRARAMRARTALDTRTIFAIRSSKRHLPPGNASGMPVEEPNAIVLFFPDPLLIGAAAGASFLTGLGGSGHCALMCGPLACLGLDGDRRTRRRAALAWQAGRIGMYAAVGALLGTLGHAGVALTRAPIARALPWLMAAGLVLSACEVGRRLPALPGLARIPRAMGRLAARLSPVARGALRGAATPFLPCGLLYGAFVVAVGAGAAAGGAVIMIAFALGAIPALALLQLGAPRFADHQTAGRVARRVLPLVAAAVIVWRAVHARGAGAPHCH